MSIARSNQNAKSNSWIFLNSLYNGFKVNHRMSLKAMVLGQVMWIINARITFYTLLQRGKINKKIS